MKRPPGQKLTLSKIDAAEVQLRAAVRMFFESQNPVPVFTLANAVREVVAQIGEHIEVETAQQELANAPGIPVAELVQNLKRTANFLKHADRDPGGRIDFYEDDLEVVLVFAVHDFGRVAGGMPIEAQVFEAWIYAAVTERVSDAPLHRQRLSTNSTQTRGPRGTALRQRRLILTPCKLGCGVGMSWSVHASGSARASSSGMSVLAPPVPVGIPTSHG